MDLQHAARCRRRHAARQDEERARLEARVRPLDCAEARRHALRVQQRPRRVACRRRRRDALDRAGAAVPLVERRRRQAVDHRPAVARVAQRRRLQPRHGGRRLRRQRARARRVRRRRAAVAVAHDVLDVGGCVAAERQPRPRLVAAVRRRRHGVVHRRVVAAQRAAVARCRSVDDRHERELVARRVQVRAEHRDVEPHADVHVVVERARRDARTRSLDERRRRVERHDGRGAAREHDAQARLVRRRRGVLREIGRRDVERRRAVRHWGRWRETKTIVCRALWRCCGALKKRVSLARAI